MNISREDAHNLIDNLFDLNAVESVPTITFQAPADDAGELAIPERTLPEGKRAVRLTGGGDRVYYLDEDKKTRQWVTNPDVLDSLGFGLGDVAEVAEDELNAYKMGPALYRRVDAKI